MKKYKSIGGGRQQIYCFVVAGLMTFSSASIANYSCSGGVGYLGVEGSGDVVVAIAGSTPIHRICNMSTQGAYGLSVASCKAVYASILSAKLVGRNMTVYYNDNGFNCGTLPSWGAVPTVYFVEGPL